jgi:hypothetical protein
METILKGKSEETINLLVDMIFGDLKASEVMELQNLSEDIKRKFIIERMKAICEQVRS